MNNSFQLKNRELRLLVLFLLIITEMRFSAALECAACVCFFFSENCEFGKKSTQNLWTREKWRIYCETVRKTVKLCDTRWNRDWEVYLGQLSLYFIFWFLTQLQLALLINKLSPCFKVFNGICTRMVPVFKDYLRNWIFSNS